MYLLGYTSKQLHHFDLCSRAVIMDTNWRRNEGSSSERSRGLSSLSTVDFTAAEIPEFVTSLDVKYICQQCKQILLPPVKQTGCGHRLCQRCVDAIFQYNYTLPCPGNEPDCVQISPEEVYPDWAISKELLRLQVYCPNRQSGCDAEIRWSAVERHKETCSFQEVERTVAMRDVPIAELDPRPRPLQNSADMSDIVQRLESTIGIHDVRIAESDLRFRLLETASFDGRLIWRIPNYRRRRQDAAEGRTLSLYSQPFYSSNYGYKMCARVYLNGDGLGKGTHLSLYFVVMKGEYDALLQWPFGQKVTMALLDQAGGQNHITDSFRPDPTSRSFHRPSEETNNGYGNCMFAPLGIVEADPYIKDDVMFIGMSIDMRDLPQIGS